MRSDSRFTPAPASSVLIHAGKSLLGHRKARYKGLK